MAPRISEAESQVMEAVWAADAGGLGAEAILAAVGPANGWTESTVRTLIHRLIRKAVLKSERRPGGGVIYAPLMSREAWVSAESQGLVDRLFGGQVASMVAHVARDRSLSAEDVARLRRLVADLDADEED
jgi:BlaI family penicillinase repressor